ncbi:MAG: hypothetical protein SP4CHLAM5_10450 [Chlamydiia bacterium]|nr:hypothetical protein [Chlamydiia bacterium]
MKKALFALLLSVASCLSANLQIERFVPGLNIYVFTGGIVVKTDRAIPTKDEGDYVDFNEDHFYTYESFRQNIRIVRRVNVGTDVRRKRISNKSDREIRMSDDNSDLEQTHITDTVQRYENQVSIEEFIFTPIGILGDGWYDIEGFKDFLDYRCESTPLRNFSSKLLQGTWFSGYKQHAKQISDYSAWRETGDVRTAYLLLDEYKNFTTVDYTPMTYHEIYPVFHKHDPSRLVAVFSTSYGRKRFLYDYVNSIAFFD